MPLKEGIVCKHPYMYVCTILHLLRTPALVAQSPYQIQPPSNLLTAQWNWET
jgi:hypothetical protein